MPPAKGDEAANKPVEKKKEGGDEKDDKGMPLTEGDIKLFKKYGRGPYTDPIKKSEDDIKSFNQKISELCGIKDSDTGLSLPS